MDSVPEILRWLDAEPTVARFSSAAAKLDQAEKAGMPAFRLAILRNVSLEPALPYIKVKCYAAGFHPSVYVGPYDVVEQEALDPNSPLYQWRPDVIVLALRIHVLAPKLIYRFTELSAQQIDELADGVLQRIGGIMRALREHSPALAIVHNFELAYASAQGVLDAVSNHSQQNTIRRINQGLIDLVSGVSNALILDLEHLLAKVGYEAGLDERFWQIGRVPYTPVMQKALAVEYAKYARALKGKNKKCLVLDCDNTLWGGVIGEDGMQGIALGAAHPGSAFVDFQAALLDLCNRGILLAICSKNNERDVLEVFASHPSSLLKRENFVCTKINWSDKASNIREIAAELNIGLDTMVYLDDSKFECEWVRERIPELTVIQLPPDPTRYRRLVQDSDLFDTLTLSDEDRRRSSMYQASAQRKSLQEAVGSLEEYLQSLQMTLTIGKADAFSIPRIAQLTQKTNQFNLTTRRYSEGDVERMARDSTWCVYYARLQDRFDDSGIIAAAMVRHEGDISRLDTFLMSCRVIGRGVEGALLCQIADDSHARGSRRLLGEYLSTAKNGLAAEFLPGQGFQKVSSEEAWELQLPAKLVAPAWFQSIALEAPENKGD